MGVVVAVAATTAVVLAAAIMVKLWTVGMAAPLARAAAVAVGKTLHSCSGCRRIFSAVVLQTSGARASHQDTIFRNREQSGGGAVSHWHALSRWVLLITPLFRRHTLPPPALTGTRTHTAISSVAASTRDAVRMVRRAWDEGGNVCSSVGLVFGVCLRSPPRKANAVPSQIEPALPHFGKFIAWATGTRKRRQHGYEVLLCCKTAPRPQASPLSRPHRWCVRSVRAVGIDRCHPDSSRVR